MQPQRPIRTLKSLKFAYIKSKKNKSLIFNKEKSIEWHPTVFDILGGNRPSFV